MTLVGYVLEILGTLWPDAAFLQPYSLFHYLHPLEILGGKAAPGDFVGAGGRAGGEHGLRAVAVPAPGPGRADLTPGLGPTGMGGGQDVRPECPERCRGTATGPR